MGVAAPIFKGDHHKNSIIYQQLYDQLPERAKKVDVNVYEYTHTEWSLVEDWYQSKDNVAGIYFPNSSSIYVVNEIHWDVIGNEEVSKPVFVHEYGHHVFFKILTAEERADWKKFWEANQVFMPRDYAQSNESEGFAECFAFTYYKGPTKLWKTVKPELIKEKISSYFNN